MVLVTKATMKYFGAHVVVRLTAYVYEVRNVLIRILYR